MSINRTNPDKWKADVAQSVDMYNAWFMAFAPETYRATRKKTTQYVADTLKATNNLTLIDTQFFKTSPQSLGVLRMVTSPPLARDRLIGLAGVPDSLIDRMESRGLLPVRMPQEKLDTALSRIGGVISKLIDKDIFTWLQSGDQPSDPELYRASSIVADRMCGANADPIIRNAQEGRQLQVIKEWLVSRGYRQLLPTEKFDIHNMPAGTFSFRRNVRVKNPSNTEEFINIPVDVVLQPLTATTGALPILIEAKSAGDFANVNKRRKEEAQKNHQLKLTYGDSARLILFLCGYFSTAYLGYSAAEGLDWVWEHRIEDMALMGL